MDTLEREHHDYFSVSFRIINNNLDPLKLTELLGIKPDRAHKNGDPNTGIAKSGKIIHYAPFRTGLWSIDSNLDKYCRLHEHFIHLLKRLEPHKDKLVELYKDGFDLDFFCGYFFTNANQPGFALTNEILVKMGALGIKLNICLYPL